MEVRTAPCCLYVLVLAPAVRHKFHSPVVALVRIHIHSSAVLEEVEPVCHSYFVGRHRKDECSMSSNQSRKSEGHRDDADGMMSCW